MTLQTHRPLALIFALAITLALWTPTIANRTPAPSLLTGQSASAQHLVFASTSPVVLM